MRQGWLWYVVCILFVSGSGWLSNAMAVSRLLKTHSASHTVAVLELYTSEG